MEVASRDATTIATTSSGDGAPLVLVDGASASHRSWDLLTPYLVDRFTVHAVARRGHPPSGDTEPYALEREFEDVVAVVEALEPPVRLLGHSSGGLCALEAALRTRALARLVLYEPAMGLAADPTDLVTELERLVVEGRREEALVTFLRRATSTTEEVIAQLRLSSGWEERVEAAVTIPRELRALARYRFAPDRFPALDVPTLLVRGDASPARTAEIASVLEQSIQGSETVLVRGAGHAAHLTAPAALAAAIMPFLE